VVILKAAVVVVDSRWVVEEEQREEHRVEGIAAQQRPHSIADSIEHMPRSHLNTISIFQPYHEFRSLP
jgi:hypothetical protein